MQWTYQIANAPCSWGVDFADRPENPGWRRVMDEVAAAGFSAIDLGPVGYLPTDPLQLKDELAARELRLSAGGLFDPLSDRAALAAIIDKTRRTCRILAALNAPRLVIIDGVSSQRGATAGRSTSAQRLDREKWDAMIDSIAIIARIAREEYGVASYLHAHAGCYIEFEDELDRAMEELPPEMVGLCIDTGHAAYAGIDPVSLINRYGSRIGHMHFKNIDSRVHAACLREGIGFFDAVARKIFCPLKEGSVDFVAVRDALESIEYAGIAVVEQDIDPTGDASPLDNARGSYAYLKSIGLAPDKRRSP